MAQYTLGSVLLFKDSSTVYGSEATDWSGVDAICIFSVAGAYFQLASPSSQTAMTSFVSYDQAVTYSRGDLARHGGKYYVARRSTVGEVPTINSQAWMPTSRWSLTLNTPCPLDDQVALYAIHKDFTPNLSLPLVRPNDRNAIALLGRAMMQLDTYSGQDANTEAVSEHNTAPDSHSDIRTVIAGKQDSLTISTVGEAMLALATPASQKIPRINANGSVTLIDVPSGGGGTSFEPSSILGLRAHYDPSVAGSCLGSTLAPLSSKGACRRWLDLTGNGRHLEETNAAYQATFKPAFVNGVAALDLGSSGRFSRSLNLGTEGYPEITIYMLRARKTSGAAWGNWFTNTAAYEGPNKLNAHAPYSTGDSYFDFGNDTSYRLNPGYAAISYDHTAWHSLAFVRSRQRLMLFVNGSLESASSIQAPLTAFTNSAATLYFGNYTTPQPANAYFGPLLMVGRALTQYELGQLDAYYSARGYR